MIMTRNVLISVSAIALAFTASCSSDIPVFPHITETVYSGKTLSLDYNGQEMPGKFIRLIPDRQNKAVLVCGSRIDLSQIPGMSLSGQIDAPGVLPGSPLLQIPITLVPDEDNGRYTFSGSGETDFVIYDFSGNISTNGLELDFEKVRLKNLSLASSVWIPAPLKRSESNPLLTESSPLHVIWDIDPVPGLDLDIPVNSVIQLLLSTPFIPVKNNTAYSSPARLLTETLQTVAFNPDGNIPVRYMSTADGAAQMRTTTGNTLQYTVTGTSSLKLFINPLSAFSIYLTNRPGGNGYDGDETITFSMPSSRHVSPGIQEQQYGNILPVISALLSSGIPLEFTRTSSTLDIYLDKEISEKILWQVILPLASDKTLSETLKASLASDPEIATILPEIQKALDYLPAIAQATRHFELGFSFLSQAAPDNASQPNQSDR